MRDFSEIEARILDTTLYLIGKSGSFNVSIRQIAKEAKVNIASVNYYFGTKEGMLGHVKEYYFQKMISAYKILDNKKYSLEDRLTYCSNAIMEYALKYPGILIILKEAREKKEESEINERIDQAARELNEKMFLVLESIVGASIYNRMIFHAAILYPILFEGLKEDEADILQSKEDRIAYIRHIITKLKNK